jgi:hypothetical protein
MQPAAYIERGLVKCLLSAAISVRRRKKERRKRDEPRRFLRRQLDRVAVVLVGHLEEFPPPFFVLGNLSLLHGGEEALDAISLSVNLHILSPAALLSMSLKTFEAPASLSRSTEKDEPSAEMRVKGEERSRGEPSRESLRVARVRDLEEDMVAERTAVEKVVVRVRKERGTEADGRGGNDEPSQLDFFLFNAKRPASATSRSIGGER